MTKKKVIKAKPNKLQVRAPSSSYNKDFYKWSCVQADLLRKGCFEKVDIENIVEEIESLGRSNKHALRSFLKNVLLHKLKLKYQSEKQIDSNSWENSIRDARDEIDYLLKESPSLNNEIPKLLESAYKAARNGASGETKIDKKKFPVKCPWTKDEVLKG